MILIIYKYKVLQLKITIIIQILKTVNRKPTTKKIKFSNPKIKIINRLKWRKRKITKNNKKKLKAIKIPQLNKIISNKPSKNKKKLKFKIKTKAKINNNHNNNNNSK